MKYLLFSFFVLTFWCGSRASCAEGGSTSTLATIKWKREITMQLPEVLCQSQGYYKTCYTLDQQTCQSEVRSQAKDCLTRLQLPPQIDLDTNGVSLSLQLGQCVANRLQRTWEPLYRADPVCTMGAAWL